MGPECAAGAHLDLHEGIGDPRSGGCGRWPELLYLVDRTTGQLVYGRCKATNLCRYCQTLYVVETSEMLQLDAAEHAPSLWVVLTAREHLTRDQCRDHLRQLRRAARRRWPDCEWFVQVEFQKRGALHLNLLVKGVDTQDADQLLELLSRRWCDRVDAEPVGQEIRTVTDAGGLTRYLEKTLSHGLKREQAPPLGWRGHRTSQTRGYLVRPASVMRLEARASLRARRELHKARQLHDQAADVELAVARALELAAAADWTLHRTPLRRRPIHRRERERPASVPADLLIAAWEWRDEQDRIAAARESIDLAAGPVNPPRGPKQHVQPPSGAL